MDNDFVAEFCKKHYPETVSQVIGIADDICRHSFGLNMPYDLERSPETLSFSGKIKWDYLPENGDSEFLWQFNRHRFFITLAQAYRLTGDGRYADCFCELINDWIDNVPYNSDTGNKMWRSLEVGLRGEYWTLALRLFEGSDKVKSCREKIRKSLAFHAEILESASDDWITLSNWGVIQDHGLFDIAEELGDAELKKLAARRLETQARLQVSADGIHWEQSPLYHAEVLKCFLDVFVRASWSGFELSDDLRKAVFGMAKACLFWKKPNHRHPLLGDSDDSDAREILTLSAIVFKSGLLKSGAFDKPDFETAWLCGREEIETFFGIQKKEPDYPNVFFQESGNYILRTDYSPRANYLYFKNSFIGSGHGHSDKLHIELCINGEEILLDSGRYTYLPTKERFYLKSPAAHNVPAVDGGDYTVTQNGSNGWAYDSTALGIRNPVFEGKDYVYLSGGYYYLGKGYIERRILWLKPDIYLISDYFKLEGRHTVFSYYHVPEWGRLEPAATSVNYKGRNIDARFSIFGADTPYVGIVSTPVSRAYNQKTARQCCKIESDNTDCQSHTVIIAPPTATVAAKSLIIVGLLEQEIPQWSIMRFYKINSGSIKIDSIPASKTIRESVHDLFSMVLRECLIV